ncbi:MULTISPECIES: hypothetical protein [Romboutsia]|nr:MULTISPECIES: hypothetical protein [Romboutsia]
MYKKPIFGYLYRLYCPFIKELPKALTKILIPFIFDFAILIS